MKILWIFTLELFPLLPFASPILAFAHSQALTFFELEVLLEVVCAIQPTGRWQLVYELSVSCVTLIFSVLLLVSTSRVFLYSFLQLLFFWLLLPVSFPTTLWLSALLLPFFIWLWFLSIKLISFSFLLDLFLIWFFANLLSSALDFFSVADSVLSVPTFFWPLLNFYTRSLVAFFSRCICGILGTCSCATEFARQCKRKNTLAIPLRFRNIFCYLTHGAK